MLLRILQIFVLFGLLWNSLWADDSDAVRFRRMLAEIVRAESLPENQVASNYRKVLAEYSDLIAILSNREKANTLIRAAGVAEPLEASAGQISEVFNLQEYRNSLTQLKANAQGKPWAPALANLDSLLLNGLDQTSSEELYSAISRLPKDQRAEILKRIPDQVFQNSNRKLETVIAKLKFSSSPFLVSLFQDFRNINLPGLTQEEKIFFADSFLKYFDELDLASKRKILNAWLSLPPGASKEKQISVTLQNAGPTVQKLFQRFGREIPSPQMQAVMTELLSDVKPISFQEAKAVMEAELGGPLENFFKIPFKEKHLAAGTIGQLYEATLRDTGETVVIKVLRPGLKEKIESEFTTLKSIMRERPAVVRLVEKIEAIMKTELDFSLEAANIEKAKAYRNAKLGVSTPDIVERFRPRAGSKILVMTKAPGVPLEKLQNLDLKLKAQILESVTATWFDEFMFGTGFFHADPHPGNILVDLRPGGNPPFQVSIIDIGMASSMDLELRRDLLKLIGHTMVGDANEILSALKPFGSIPQEKEAQLLRIIREIAGSNDLLFNKVNRIAIAAQGIGLDLHPSLVAYAGASGILESEIIRNNAEIKLLNGRLKVKDPGQIYMMSALRSLGVNLPIKKNGEEYILNKTTIQCLFMAVVKKLKIEAVSGCRGVLSRLGLSEPQDLGCDIHEI